MTDAETEAAFRRAAEHATELLPELEFLRMGETMVIDVGPEPITGVRLDLRKKDPLRLQSITLSGVVPQPSAVVSTSGWSGPELDAAAVMDAGDGAGFALAGAPHTWLELSFDDPATAARGIVLRNVDTQLCHSASGVVVSVRDRAGAWRTVFDGAARIEDAREQVMERARAQHDEEQLIALMGCVFATAVGEYREARLGVASFKRRMSDDRRAALKAVVNPIFLLDRCREWTAHGPIRSFRFWSTEEKQAYIASAAQLAADLGDLTPRVCFGFGAALAVERDQDLIPHDDDLDLIIAFGSDEATTLTEGLERVETHLRSRGYEVVGESFAHRQAGLPGTKKVDVFVGLFDHRTTRFRRRGLEDAEMSWYPGPRGMLTVGDVFPTSRRTLLGVDVPMPRSPERYLETQYGSSWRVPNPGFRHRWTTRPYGDIAKAPDATSKRPG